jgi:hypothetical protein
VHKLWRMVAGSMIQSWQPKLRRFWESNVWNYSQQIHPISTLLKMRGIFLKINPQTDSAKEEKRPHSAKDLFKAAQEEWGKYHRKR